MTKRMTKRERRAHIKREKAYHGMQEQILQYQREQVQEITTLQYIAITGSEHARRCPATGRAVDPSLMPDAATGPFFSKPFGLPGFRKRRKWTLTPVLLKACGVLLPCASIMWASVEAPA